MIDLLTSTREILAEDGYECISYHSDDIPYLTFENSTFMGFVLQYDEPKNLIENWHNEFNQLITKHQFAFRLAKIKAWNTYVLLLTSGSATQQQSISMMNIEEDLSEARKIAKSNLGSYDQLREALLPLIHIQSAPNLGVIDFEHELKLRLADLPDSIFELFMSNASEEQVLELLESTQ